MLIQVFSKYYNLAQAGDVEFLACPMHEQDKPAIFPLVHQDLNGKVMLQCNACGYINIAGQTLYENIIERMKRMGKWDTNQSQETTE